MTFPSPHFSNKRSNHQRTLPMECAVPKVLKRHSSRTLPAAVSSVEPLTPSPDRSSPVTLDPPLLTIDEEEDEDEIQEIIRDEYREGLPETKSLYLHFNASVSQAVIASTDSESPVSGQRRKECSFCRTPTLPVIIEVEEPVDDDMSDTASFYSTKTMEEESDEDTIRVADEYTIETLEEKESYHGALQSKTCCLHKPIKVLRQMWRPLYSLSHHCHRSVIAWCRRAPAPSPIRIEVEVICH